MQRMKKAAAPFLVGAILYYPSSTRGLIVAHLSKHSNLASQHDRSSLWRAFGTPGMAKSRHVSSLHEHWTADDCGVPVSLSVNGSSLLRILRQGLAQTTSGFFPCLLQEEQRIRGDAPPAMVIQQRPKLLQDKLLKFKWTIHNPNV